MKGKLVMGLVAVMAVAIGTILLAARGPSARAQPVASISLPAPGAVKQLYPNCNNITLTFPDGTPSQSVVQAVMPPDAVESLWRHSAVLGRFEGFNPAFPGASDLPSVDFLDAVWLCMAGGPAPMPPPPGATATPTPTSPPGAPPPPPPPPPTATPTSPPPPPGGGSWGILTAELSATDLFIKPNAEVWLRVVNGGPDAVNNVTVDQTCTMERTEWLPPNAKASQTNSGPVNITVGVGQTLELNTGFSHFDLMTYWYKVTCTVNVPFNDPIPANNTYFEYFPQP